MRTSIVLGETIGICAKCGEKFIYEGARQKYCKKCADSAIRENDRIKGRGNLQRTIEKHGQQYADDRKAARRVPPKHCKICGILLKGIAPNRESCDECRRLLLQYKYYITDIKMGRSKNAIVPFEEWRNSIHRRKDSKTLIKNWRTEHPNGSAVECAAATNLCKQTVYKWWKIIQKEIENGK